MMLRWIFGIAIVIGIAAVAAPVRASDSNCWKLINAAFNHGAEAPHAKFISYDERSAITADRRTLEDVRAQVTYRDDGLAYIADNRFSSPFTSMKLEPGPPVLGPYGDARAAWLSMNDDTKSAMPVIAHVYAYPNESCRDAGAANVAQSVRHLVLGENRFDRAGLREIWIDPIAMEINRVVIRAPIHFFSAGSAATEQDLTDYLIDIEHVGQFSVVARVTWRYRDSDGAQYTAEYDFNNYRFSDIAPPGTFVGVHS